jgi:hypothetical protein
MFFTLGKLFSCQYIYIYTHTHSSNLRTPSRGFEKIVIETEIYDTPSILILL